MSLVRRIAMRPHRGQSQPIAILSPKSISRGWLDQKRLREVRHGPERAAPWRSALGTGAGGEGGGRRAEQETEADGSSSEHCVTLTDRDAN